MVVYAKCLLGSIHHYGQHLSDTACTPFTSSTCRCWTSCTKELHLAWCTGEHIHESFRAHLLRQGRCVAMKGDLSRKCLAQHPCHCPSAGHHFGPCCTLTPDTTSCILGQANHYCGAQLQASGTRKQTCFQDHEQWQSKLIVWKKECSHNFSWN